MRDAETQENAAPGGTCEAGCSASPRQIVDCDREVWVKDRVAVAMRMALALERTHQQRADEHTFACALDGLANGAAVEIVRTLGMEPGFVNLRRPPNGKDETHDDRIQ